MGNQAFKHGSIFVQTDKPYYNPGDTVTGHVYVNMQSLFPAGNVYLKVKGFEKSYWTEQKTRWEDRNNPDGTTSREAVHYYEKYEGKNSFYSHKFCLNSWGLGNIPIGQYSLPFSFVLQSNLPGSFKEEGPLTGPGTSSLDKEHYKAKICYKIKAETDSGAWDKMKHTQELVVRESMKQMQQQQVGEMVKNTKEWCCIDRGQSQIKCFFENNSYLPGEQANVVTEIDNSKCQMGISSINADFIKKIRLESKTSSRVVQVILSRNKFKGLAAGQKQNGEQAQRTPVALTSNSRPIQPSTNGNLVSCQYFLTISSDMDGVTCCAEDPNVTVPIQILAPPPPNYGTVQQPQGWAPQVLSCNNLTFSASNMYAGGGVSVSMNVGGAMAAPPQMNISANMNVPPPQAQVNVQVNDGFNAPPGGNVQMNVGVSDPGFNAPPGGNVQMNVGVNDGFNAPPGGNVQMNVGVNDGFNAPPGGNVQMNVGAGFNAPPGANVTLSTDDSQAQINMNMQV